MRAHTRPVLFAALAAGLVAGAAAADPVVLHTRTLSRSGAPMSPAVAVAFNPQPDPPGTPSARLDLSDPQRPVYAQVNRSGGAYSLSIGFNNGDRNPIRLLPPGPCVPADPNLPPGPCKTSIYGLAADGTRFQVALEISSADGSVDRSSWVAFNPQPDPPGYPGTVTVNFALGTRSSSTSAQVAMRLVNLDWDSDLALY